MNGKKKPATFDQLYPGRFLKAGTLDGKKVTLTIKDADLDELEGDDGKKLKAIIAFEETDMQMVCCKTNGICIKAMFGDKISAWVGKRVTLFEGQWNGEPCIRIFGSPDIKQAINVNVVLPRRKPIPMVLQPVVKQAPAPVPAD